MNRYRNACCFALLGYNFYVTRYSSVNDIREDSTRRQIFVENAIVLPSPSPPSQKNDESGDKNGEKATLPNAGLWVCDATFENRTKHGSQ